MNKKVLVVAVASAVASLTATASFAQVTLSGNLDFAASSTSGTQYGAKGSTVSTTVGTASTSAIKITAVEKLDGGLVATAHYEIDPRTLANDSYAVTNNSSTSTTGQITNTATGAARGEAYVSLSGGFGRVFLGSPNAIGLDAHSVSSPLGTGIGSGYAPASNTVQNAVVQTRYSRSIRYNTPTMEGFSGAILYAPGNDEAGVAATSGASANVARLMPNARQTTEFGVNYNQGPMNVSFAQIKQAAQTNQTGWYAQSALGALTALSYVATTSRAFGANYKVGETTLYVGRTSGDAMTSTTAVSAVSGTRLAIKQNFGLADLMAQRTSQKIAGVDTKVTGLRADYNMSKTAAAYVGYEYWDTGVAASTNSATTGERKITSIGLKKSF